MQLELSQGKAVGKIRSSGFLVVENSGSVQEGKDAALHSPWSLVSMATIPFTMATTRPYRERRNRLVWTGSKQSKNPRWLVSWTLYEDGGVFFLLLRDFSSSPPSIP